MADRDINSSAAPVFGSSFVESALAPASHSASQRTIEPPAVKSLKRSRPEQVHEISSSPTKSHKFGGSFSNRLSPAPMTGAAALAEERQRKEQRSPGLMSENPGHKILASLIAGGGAGMSKPSDAPPATTALSGGMSVAANAITVSSPTHYEDKSETSPASVTSLASLNSTAQTVTASTTAVASPAGVFGLGERESRDVPPAASKDSHLSVEDQDSSRAFSYPGNAIARMDAARGPNRGMSLPMSGLTQQIASRSPSTKKHKCPYCETEFTRHHNLKSHLLTHSQEKPYVCSTCQMRFRRLHDLKRHTKLHTGERPHICPKCDRKFARGDALARHAKGQGGCAGRRASVGSYGGEDDYEGSHGEDGGMDGVLYTEPEQTTEDISEEDPRRSSLPSIKTQHVQGNPPAQESYASFSRTPSTYPPAGPRQRQSSSSLYPPGGDHGTSSSSGTTASLQTGGGGHHSSATSTSPGHSISGGFAQAGGMTESPKPLSPAATNSHQLGHDLGSISRQRSPSLTTQFRQQHFGSRDSARSSPQMSLPSAHGTKLPAMALSPPGPPSDRSMAGAPYTLSSQQPGQSYPPNGGSHGQSSNSMAGGVPLQSHMGPTGQRNSHVAGPQHQQGGSGEGANNLFASGEQGVWTYIQSLEERIKQLSEKVSNLENVEKHNTTRIAQLSDEVVSLRNQGNRSLQYSQHSSMQQ